MTQFAQVTTDISNLSSGVGSGVGWAIQPLGGATTIAEALSLTGGRQARANFFGDGTQYYDYRGKFASLSYPLSGNHDLRIIYTCTTDGDIQLRNGFDDSLIFITGMAPDATQHDTTYTLTGPEVAEIIDYSNILLHLYAADDDGTFLGVGADVQYASLTIPNLDPAGPPATPAGGSRTEFDPDMLIRNWF